MAKRTDAERMQLAEVVCESMRDGLSLRKACIEIGITASTFLEWVSKDEVLADQYTRAREAMLDKMADELLEIADAPVGTTDTGSTDSGAVQKQRLQVDSRKWLLSKLAPKKYGDKVEQTLLGADGGAVQVAGTINVNFKGASK